VSNLEQAMQEVNNLNRTEGVTQRGGKKYTMVSVRVEAFRKAFGMDYGIETEIISYNGENVIAKAVIKNKDGMIIGSGYAEEIRGSSNVNKTSAIENCETSAVGRALASIGLHGGQYASINEVEQAQQKEVTIDERASWQQFADERIGEVQGIKDLDELKQWDEYFSDQLDKLNLEYPKIYAQIETEVNKRKAFL
tara:strand:+ start:1170 stop:1754 length:585 start_codon:yes stop_codon:yes gene_type:complete